jgi:bifunctional DNA-binding transcriptional regulator/antitoxin component of YhaV-PrlF toxin-antitoxin module
MKQTLKVKADAEGRTFIDLPAALLKSVGWKVGDWLELKLRNSAFTVRKIETSKITFKVKPADPILRAIEEYQKNEGYLTSEEAATNLLINALVSHLETSDKKEVREMADGLRNTWIVRLHRPK